MSYFRKARMVVPIVVLALVAVSLSAQAAGQRKWTHRGESAGYVSETLRHLLNQTGNKPLSALTGAEIRKALDELSVARQKQAFVRRSEMASLFVPGAGQFMNHAPAAGALYLTGNLAVAAGTLVGAYFLLPKDLQFGTINYFTDTFDNIRTAWLGHSFLDYLPSAAVMAGGMVLDHLIRHLAAKNAGELARASIKDRKVTFRPEPFMVIPGPRGPRMGFGLGMRF